MGESSILKTPRGSVEFVRCGEGPAVLLLHGAMGGYDQGLLLGRAAIGSSGFEFIAVSRPGYLGTPLAMGRTPEEQADICAAVLDGLEIRDAGVVAVSGGGQCALQFALRFPDRCRALVMISCCSAQLKTRVPLRFHVMRMMAAFPAVVGAMQKKVLKAPERAFADPEAGAMLREMQLGVFERIAERMPGTVNDIRQSRSPFDYPVERIAAPVLVVHGEADEAAPFEDAERLARRVRAGELLAIPGGTHVSLFTHRQVIQPRVTEFLSGLLRT
jgi:pimeloyl-ACP methyl ester carboxylesterase